MRLGLEVIHRAKLGKLAGRMLPRAGVIFALHRVKPAEPSAFAPNNLLEVTPEFLDQTIRTVRAEGFEIVALDEALERLRSGRQQLFACFTLDDAYRDNKVWAAPVFQRHNVPYTIYVPTSFADGTGQLWWVELESAIAAANEIEVPALFPGELLACDSVQAKYKAYDRIYWRLRRMEEAPARAIVRDMCQRAGVDVSAICRDLIMTWDEIRELAKNPLVTIGAHTVDHFAVAKLPRADALQQLAPSKSRIESETGRACRHFCFPYGDPQSAGVRDFALAEEAGFLSAVTMRKGLIEPRHAAEMLSLPRCSLNGNFQDQRYVAALLSGLPFVLWNALFARRDAGQARQPAGGHR